MKPIFYVLLLLCPYLSDAQKALSIGDTLPIEYMQLIFRHRPVSGITYPASPNPQFITSSNQALQPPSLNILDFYATWCGSCINGLSKLNSLQNEWNGRLQVTLINSYSTGDDAKKINAFFKKFSSKIGPMQQYNMLVKDSIFKKLFPHQQLPHYVWIDNYGKIIAITGSDELTQANITAAIQGNTLGLIDKSALQKFNPESSLFLPGISNDSLAAIQFSSSSTAPPPFIAKFYHAKSQSFRRTTIIQKTALLMYQVAAGFAANRLVLELPQTAVKQLHNFELTSAASLSDSAFNQLMLQRLNQHLHINARWQTKKVQAWAITMQSKKQLLQKQQAFVPDIPKGQVLFNNQSFHQIAQTLNSTLLKDSALPIIINKTGYNQPVSLLLPSAAFKGDLKALTQALQQYGLNLKSVTVNLPMFIISQQSTPFNHQN